MFTRVITLSGNMGSGKDTVAGFIKEVSPSTQLYAFADHLKQIAMDVYYCTYEEVYGEHKEEPFKDSKGFGPKEIGEIHLWVKSRNHNYDDVICLNRATDLAMKKDWEFKTPRSLLQFLGTELLRDCYSKEYHIKQVENRIVEDAPHIAVVTDARFPNERSWAKKFGATTVLITGRTREDFIKGGFSKHASETGLGEELEYDILIENTGTLEDLSKETYTELKHLLLTN